MAQPLDRRQALIGDLAHALDEEAERLVAERQHDRFLVLEVEVERGRRHTHHVGDPADRRGLVALPDEQLLRCQQDLVAPGVTLAASLPGADRRRGQMLLHPLTYI